MRSQSLGSDDGNATSDRTKVFWMVWGAVLQCGGRTIGRGLLDDLWVLHQSAGRYLKRRKIDVGMDFN